MVVNYYLYSKADTVSNRELLKCSFVDVNLGYVRRDLRNFWLGTESIELEGIPNRHYILRRVELKI